MSHSETDSTPQTPEPQVTRFLRIAAVVRLTGLGRSTIYRLVAAEQFPSPVRLAKRAVAWRQSDLELWSAKRPLASH